MRLPQSRHRFRRRRQWALRRRPPPCEPRPKPLASDPRQANPRSGRLLWIMKIFPSRAFVMVLLSAIAIYGSVAPSAQTKPSGRAIGPVIAKVRIDLFSDFQCPSCKALAEGTLKRIREDYAL